MSRFNPAQVGSHDHHLVIVTFRFGFRTQAAEHDTEADSVGRTRRG